ncbi:MAG: hypothetical protein EON57_05495 [Alphaproteobacteria bacterium]|nr:MAG: hypothetical protein EON57_05495 [Alphaproteobacteria bacterium]
MSEQEEIIALMNEALLWAESTISSALAEPFAGQCANAFAMVLEYDLKNGSIGHSTLAEYHSAGLSVADVGLILIDGVVSTIKDKGAGQPEDQRMRHIVDGLEKTIDGVVEAGEVSIFPGNGKYAQAG